jgi:hypothetical protein
VTNAAVRTACLLVVLSACGHAAAVHTMAPRTCAEPSWSTLTPPDTIVAARGTAVGITIAKGRSNYTLDYAFVELLAPDAVLDGSDAPIYEHRNKSLLAASAHGPAADRRVAVDFTGADADGRPLPAGKYPVVFALGATHAGACTAGSFGVSGVLATLDWRG